MGQGEEGRGRERGEEGRTEKGEGRKGRKGEGGGRRGEEGKGGRHTSILGFNGRWLGPLFTDGALICIVFIYNCAFNTNPSIYKKERKEKKE